MFANKFLLLAIIFAACLTNEIFAKPEPTKEINNSNTRWFFPTPIQVVKWQIRKFVETVENIINFQLSIIDNIRKTAIASVENSIKLTIKAIDVVIFGTIGTMRRILQIAIDKGINVTECYVLNMDKLAVLRRRLIIEEVQCATSQLDELIEILDRAVVNFTNNLELALELPVRFVKCFVTLLPIRCINRVVSDMTELSKTIPLQMLETMFEIFEFLNWFNSRVHKCQFDQLRKAIVESRIIIDDMLECARYHPNWSYDLDAAISDTLDTTRISKQLL